MHYIRYWVFILKVYVFLRLDEMMLNHWVTNDLKMSNQAIWKFRCSNYLIQYWHLFFQYPHRRRLYRFSNRVVRPGKARYRRSIKYFFFKWHSGYYHDCSSKENQLCKVCFTLKSLLLICQYWNNFGIYFPTCTSLSWNIIKISLFFINIVYKYHFSFPKRFVFVWIFSTTYKI